LSQIDSGCARHAIDLDDHERRTPAAGLDAVAQQIAERLPQEHVVASTVANRDQAAMSSFSTRVRAQISRRSMTVWRSTATARGASRAKLESS
jgi:hypothetical protein